jgi:hypothetical protein
VELIAEVNEHEVLLKTVPVWKMDEPRKLFARHNDFSEETKRSDSLVGNVTHLTRNGDYASFHIIFEHIMPLLARLNTMPGFSIPGQIDELGRRLRFANVSEADRPIQPASRSFDIASFFVRIG